MDLDVKLRHLNIVHYGKELAKLQAYFPQAGVLQSNVPLTR
ncbi:MAG: hypothetical protein ACTSXH_18675 [Promethearchaeota archaeon]